MMFPMINIATQLESSVYVVHDTDESYTNKSKLRFKWRQIRSIFYLLEDKSVIPGSKFTYILSFL